MQIDGPNPHKARLAQLKKAEEEKQSAKTDELSVPSATPDIADAAHTIHS